MDNRSDRSPGGDPPARGGSERSYASISQSFLHRPTRKPNTVLLGSIRQAQYDRRLQPSSGKL